MSCTTPTSLSGEGYFATDQSGSIAVVGLIEEFSISKSVDEVETTAFTEGGVTARCYEPGLYDWTADISGFLDMSDTEQTGVEDVLDSGTTITGYFYADETGNYYSGDMFMTSEDVTVPVDGLADVSFSGRGKGQLTRHTAS